MTGKVYLVGAGPGDSKLITLRAVELLKKADVVLYDRLVSKKILAMVPKKAKKVYVGRDVGDDYLHQESTNDLMVKYAKTKKKIKFEIIPGITSGIGSATYAGIPLTHRKFASSVVFVTGHEDLQKSKEKVRWKKLAQSVDTIVIMMGLSRIGIICKQLIEGGMNKKTPVAVIQEGTTPQQKMITGNVSNISKLVTQKKIRPPSIIIIGKVVNLSKTIGWK